MSPSLFSLPVYLLGLSLAFFCATFLFWRAGRYELHESELLLDLLVVSAVGAFLVGRVFEFFINYELFRLNFERLIYFHVYRSFNWWGALVGAYLATFLLLRRSKVNVFEILDLVVAPLAFGQFIYYLASIARDSLSAVGANYYQVAYFVFYFLLFWAINRFSAKKRHTGAIFAYWLVSVLAFSLIISLIRHERDTLITLGVFVLAVLIWHRLVRKKIKDEIKWVFGFVLLIILRIKRGIASLDDSGAASRFVIFLPWYTIRLILVSLRLLGREIKTSFFDFMYIWGKRR